MKQAMFAELDSDDEPEGMDEMFAAMMGGGRWWCWRSRRFGGRYDGI